MSKKDELALAKATILEEAKTGSERDLLRIVITLLAEILDAVKKTK